jgi:hypothetical protein
MKLTNLRLCPASNGRCFYIPKTHMSDNQIGEYFDLIVTPHKNKESIKHQPSIRSQILNLMSDGNTWQLSDIASEIAKQIHRDYNDVVDFVEAVLDTGAEITKAGDAQYRLLIA